MSRLVAAEIQPDGCAQNTLTRPAEDHLLECIPVLQIDDVILRLEAQLGQRYAQRCEVGDQGVLGEVVPLRAYKIGDWPEVVCSPSSVLNCVSRSVVIVVVAADKLAMCESGNTGNAAEPCANLHCLGPDELRLCFSGVKSSTVFRHNFKI